MKKFLDIPIMLELIDGYILKEDKTDELRKIAEQEIKKGRIIWQKNKNVCGISTNTT